MKLKAAIRYQTIELVQCAVAFCLIIGVLIAGFFVFALTQGAYMMMPSMGFLPYALMPILALATFSSGAQFLLQMGLSRVQVLASTVASYAAVCLFLALVEAVCAILVPFWSQGQSLFLGTYGPGSSPALAFLFMFFGCAATSAVGLALAALKMRFGTRRVVLGIVALVIIGPTVFRGEGMVVFGAPSLASSLTLFLVTTALGLLIVWAVTRRYELR